jgi:hypothetical protein
MSAHIRVFFETVDRVQLRNFIAAIVAHTLPNLFDARAHRMCNPIFIMRVRGAVFFQAN